MEKEYNLHKPKSSPTKPDVWKESSWAKLDKEITDDWITGSMLEAQNIRELYPPQKVALPLALSGKSLVLAMPTAGGKSLIGYAAAIKKALKGGKALYIVPLRALANEKYEDLKTFEKLGIRVKISTGDYETSPENLGKNDIIVCTSEKADSIIRHNPGWLSQIEVVVADEIHLIDDPDRGPILDIILAKLRLINPQIQIIALSATIPNSDEIAEWLSAEHIQSDFRPVLLKDGVFFRNVVYFSDEEHKEIMPKGDDIASLIDDTLEDGGQILIFVNTRKKTEKLALKFSEMIKLNGEERRKLEEVSKGIAGEEEISRRLSTCVKRGIAFHHAGLVEEDRKIVERFFKERLIKCIFATPTLAAGVNIPARRVVVKDLYRYSNGFNAPVSVMEVKQMLGRAGRPRYDRVGEAILMAKNYPEMRMIIDKYLLGESEGITSKLGLEKSLRIHILSSISNNFIFDKNSLYDFISKTFYGHQSGFSNFSNSSNSSNFSNSSNSSNSPNFSNFEQKKLETIVDFLKKEELIKEKRKRFRSTPFGDLVSKLYIDPLSAIKIKDALKESNTKGDFAYLHLISSLPDMRRLYLNKADYKILDDRAEKAETFFDVPDNEEDYEWFLCEIKTASVLNDWINEVKQNDIIEKYRVDPGDIRALVEIAEWLCRASAEVSRLFNRAHTKKLNVLERRIKHGIRGELLEITRIRGVGRKRGRALFRIGYRSVEELANASPLEISKLEGIGVKLAEKIIGEAKKIAERVKR
jgi:helicase